MATEVEIREESANENLKASIENLLKTRENYIQILQDIVKIVKDEKEKTGEEGFRIADVLGANGQTMLKLAQMGIVKQVRSSARRKEYWIADDISVDVIENVLSAFKARRSQVRWRNIDVPDDLFDIIVGYDDIKKFFMKALTAERAVSILLVGPPATAKSMFLMELERIGGTMILAGTGTKAGIRDIVMEERPAILLIDELDKVNNPLDISVLLTWMETGRVIVVKHKEHTDKITTTKPLVFAAANSVARLPKELLSRFEVFYLPEYTPNEFIQVTIKTLTKREGTKEKLAKYIAERLAINGIKDVRESIRVARLTDTKEEVDEIVEIIRKYQS